MSSREQPDRRAMKSGCLWYARMLVSEDGGGTPFAGKIQVEIRKRGEAEATVIKPMKGADGFSPPEPARLPPSAEVNQAELLRHLLSDDERLTLRELLKHQPCKAGDVSDYVRGRVNRNAFWTIWGNLQNRRLVIQDENDDLYRIGPEWLREVLGVEGEGRPAA